MFHLKTALDKLFSRVCEFFSHFCQILIFLSDNRAVYYGIIKYIYLPYNFITILDFFYTLFYLFLFIVEMWFLFRRRKVNTKQRALSDTYLCG